MAGPSADFSLLPYVDPVTGADVRGDAPYVSEQVVAVPFEDSGLLLEEGVHLHWTLPDALTRMEQDDGVPRMPAAPDRWLVTRTAGGSVTARWVVESDYLAPPGDGGDGVVFPADGPVPFRRTGRKLPFDGWQETTAERLAELTAIGYGEPSFAAFYPDCRTVFGLHDPDVTGVPPEHAGYDVVGWYSRPERDPLAGATDQTWRDVLAAFGWSVPDDASRPERTICYARLTFDPASAAPTPSAPAPVPSDGGDDDTGVWVGTTATEALAAHLGAEIPGLSPDETESLIEALSFADELEAKPLDVGPDLAQARHAAGFQALPSGTLWTVLRDDGPATPAQRQARDLLTLPGTVGDALNALNTAQDAYDRAQDELASRRERVFADWYKYQLCVYHGDPADHDSYPDPDDVRDFILGELGALAQATATVTDTLAAELDSARQALDAGLADLNAVATTTAASTFRAGPVAAPQFYRPAEPVVLLTGSRAAPSDRYGTDGTGTPDGLLPCAVLPGDPAQPAALQQALAALDLGATTWRHDPWHPVLLQWEVEFFPAGDNLDPSDRNYSTGFVTGSYTLPPGEVELCPDPGVEIPDQRADLYSGTTILASTAGSVVSARVLRYLAGTIVDPYNQATGATVEPEQFQDDPGTILDWYAAHGDDDRLTTLIAVYRHLQAHERDNLSQALGGFDDALLMRRLTRQLPIADPLGFPDYQTFAARVAVAVGDETDHAPEPTSDFNPIRAGAMRLSRLRVIDSFGRSRDVDVTGAATTTQLRVPGHPTWAAMAPRLAQPSRVQFRWLDAEHDLREMNDVPATSPICGWIVPDDLDAGLALHAADGTALGLVEAVAQPDDPLLARWRPAPGTSTTPDDIGNAHLRAVAARLRQLGADGVAGLVAGLGAALDRIEPEDYGDSPLSVRPLAVVRAELDLQLMGLPAVHQDWNVFRQDMQRGVRESSSFPEVLLPLRIGAPDLLDDGLAGYWTEDDDGVSGDLELITSDPVLATSLDGPPIRLTLLVDPRAPVHVTSGILPVKTAQIPSAHYRAAMTGLRVAFFTAPVLTDDDAPSMPLPDEAGQVWVWREQDPTSAWTDTTVPAARADAAFPAAATLREGWLTRTPAPDPQ
ncbi:hypothetical protein [Nonomuraea sp. NPDC050783]|uniref:hypothetical protein n=1 Tax=Nonomuraea sp. NPDC050783 TaxID=3154634 RepID=UPI0034650F21